MTPPSTRDITAMRTQKALGWSLERMSLHWNRTPAELDLILWWALGRPSGTASDSLARRAARLAA